MNSASRNKVLTTDPETSATLTVEDPAQTSSSLTPFTGQHSSPPQPSAATSDKTVFYLAYGSNLSSATLQGKRALRPISTTTVRIPDLRLTFDLPGFAYIEPCFANVRFHPDKNEERALLKQSPVLIGVVYELTPEDYSKLVATEGGGAGYGDEIVDCFPLSGDERDVVKAHTLLAPESKTRHTGAQPSLRYLEIIREGAREHKLPEEWREYLDGLQEYRTTSVRQVIGKVVWAGMWIPLVMVIIGLTSATGDKQGRSPKWLVAVHHAVFSGVWTIYDWVWKPVFGDGERTAVKERVKDIEE